MISPAVFARALDQTQRGSAAPSLCARLAAGVVAFSACQLPSVAEGFAPRDDRRARRAGNSGRHFPRTRRPA